ncbi:MAG: 2-amino-4-hydroxy-6-hydroxymethyldihydropteridine diphosphokinase, partial [Candidatus Omnitrophica bacterium]|nr:2-amino-4-hydroxy-6-hydroxymethyldihydropteridine diphosphokinase [Candidatus Omnitrophota bacterium]
QDNLKRELKKIEYDLGRPQRKEKSLGPRTIDLDILVWNDRVVSSDVYSRDFVKKAVEELNPRLSAE